MGYNASKKLAEKAAWKFLEDKKPTFDLTVINPDIIIGPMLQPVHGPRNVNETNEFAVYNFLNGTYKEIESLKFPFYHFVSLRMTRHISVLNIKLNFKRLTYETSHELIFFLCRIRQPRINVSYWSLGSLPLSSLSTRSASTSLN